VTMGHTPAQLLEKIRLDRVARGEPEEGSTASDAEVRRYLRQFKRASARAKGK
jgi:hypothetical protein